MRFSKALIMNTASELGPHTQTDRETYTSFWLRAQLPCLVRASGAHTQVETGHEETGAAYQVFWCASPGGGGGKTGVQARMCRLRVI
jgi:hypothetical protein